MNAQNAIANHFHVASTAIIEIREWATVLWVRVQDIGCRFVSKAVMENQAVDEQLHEIEYVSGREQHSNLWGKFYVKGLEEYAAKEDSPSNTHRDYEQYQCYVCLDVPAGTLFTIFEQSGDKRGTDNFYFYICEVTADDRTLKADYGSGKVEGAFRVVARATTKVKGPRLMEWWIAGPKTLAFAEACAIAIEKRGQKNPPTDY